MTSFRWIVIGLTFLASIINYLDRSALAYAIKPIEEAFKLTDMDFGLLMSVFGIGYIGMTVIGGMLVDAYGSRKVWSLFATLWSISCAGIGLATGFGGILVMRFLLGTAEGPGFPAMTRVAADWLPMKERARAFAFGLAAVPFASVIGAPLISQLIVHTGWRLMFIILGLFGLIWALVWHTFFRDKPKESRYTSALEVEYIHADQHQHAKQKQTTWRYMLTSRTLWINNYAFFAFGYLLFFAITWLPGFLEQTYHMDVKAVGWFLILPWMVGTVAILIGGFLSDWLWHRTHSIRIARSHLIWVCQMLSALSFVPILFTDSVNIAAACISLGIGFGLMPNAAFFSMNADLAHDRAATSFGIMDAAFALAGIVAPLITGWLATTTGNFHIAIGLMAGLIFSSAMLILFFQRPDQELERRRL